MQRHLGLDALRTLGAAIACTAVMTPASAQQPPDAERHAVLAVVQTFFDGMAARDVDRLSPILMPEGRFYAMEERDGKRSMRTFTNAEYVKGLPGRKQAVRERMWNPEVRIRGSIASVWTPYDFWRDGSYSHCGVDAFDLIKIDGQWRIAGGMYTVEAACEPSPLGPLKP